MRVIPAVFPDRSAIPPNPYNVSDLEQGYDDSKTPIVRTIPIEESTHGLTVSIATTAAALAKSQEQGSLVDTNILVRLLLNLQEIPKQMKEYGMATKAATVVSLNAAMSRQVDLLVPCPRQNRIR
uniref:Uncharacterized protein n=1 Tax=Solanum lycopersicum TaxID=4081 RepID=K4BAS4_SOLLC